MRPRTTNSFRLINFLVEINHRRRGWKARDTERGPCETNLARIRSVDLRTRRVRSGTHGAGKGSEQGKPRKRGLGGRSGPLEILIDIRVTDFAGHTPFFALGLQRTPSNTEFVCGHGRVYARRPPQFLQTPFVMLIPVSNVATGVQSKRDSPRPVLSKMI